MTTRYSVLSDLECPRCGAVHDAGRLQGTCGCGSPLLARYDLGLAASLVGPAEIAARPPSLWRYHELLPVTGPQNVVSFGEGMTPLISLPRLGRELGLPGLAMKDESPLPTATFKARGAAVGVSRALELGAAGVAMPTNGNAGAAWAAFCARAGLPFLVAMPADAPQVTRSECVGAGAETYVVDGLIGDAGAMLAPAVAARAGWADVSTLREPYRLEGKKTIGLEIAEQLGWRVPDVILCPCGGGVGLIGIWKALRELAELGWIGPGMPRLVAVQAAGCAPIVTAFEQGADVTSPWPRPQTAAFGLTVPAPLGGFLVLRAVRDTGGCAVAVTDAELLAAQAQAARSEGTWICPEGAACLAAAARLRESGWLAQTDEVVVLNTGAGLKYPQTALTDLPVLAADAAIPVLQD
ncbi:MAG TPA: threonine synthase [Streptosporangiaceae bacterium]|nr:threonine synthase [Streptosporangiaceae bacterium]